MKKCILIVIDSLGVGAAPDAKKYGDEESNTFGNVSRVNGELNLPTFNKLGFGRITEINGLDSEKYVATVGKLAEKSTGNDSTTGHWELAGLITKKEFQTFPKGFPSELNDQIQKEANCKFIGKKFYSKRPVPFHFCRAAINSPATIQLIVRIHA